MIVCGGNFLFYIAAAANALECTGCMKSTKSYLACFWSLILKMGSAITEEFFIVKTSLNLLLIFSFYGFTLDIDLLNQ